MRLSLALLISCAAIAQTPTKQTPATQTPGTPPPAKSSLAAPSETKPAEPAPAESIKDRAWRYLDEALKDKNPDTRKQAVQSMGLIGPREPYLASLQAMLDDKDVEVRLAAITSLLDLKNKDTIPTLKKAQADEVPEVSFLATKALWSLKDPDSEEALLSVLSGETKTTSSFFSKQKREALRLMHTPRPLVMLALKQGVGFVPVPGLGEGISSLQGILSDPRVSGRATTALLLSGDKDPRVVDALKDALEDKDGSVRAAACHALALRNDKKLEPVLIPMLDDKKPAVRMRAAAACLRLESLPAPPRKRAVTASTQPKSSVSVPPPPAKPAAASSQNKTQK